MTQMEAHTHTNSLHAMNRQLPYLRHGTACRQRCSSRGPPQWPPAPSYSSRLLLITHISLMWSISSSSVRSTPCNAQRGG